jgi:hypothetical protein
MDFNTDFLNQVGDNINPIKPSGSLPNINSNTKKYVEPARIQPTAIKKSLTAEQQEVLNSQKRERVMALANITKTSDYSEYNLLNVQYLKSLEATNYWRVMDGIPFVNVPIKDVRFWTYFDERCFGLAGQHQINTKESKAQAKIREEAIAKELELASSTKNKNVKNNKISDWVNHPHPKGMRA